MLLTCGFTKVKLSEKTVDMLISCARSIDFENKEEKNLPEHLFPWCNQCGRTRARPADYSLNQNCPTMDSRRPKKERLPQGNLEENSREGDEGKGLDMGPSGACLS